MRHEVDGLAVPDECAPPIIQGDGRDVIEAVENLSPTW